MNVFDAVAATTKERPFVQTNSAASMGIKLKHMLEDSCAYYEVYHNEKQITARYTLKEYEYKDHSWQPVE